MEVNRMIIIGFVGKKLHGKDTSGTLVAKEFLLTHQCHRLAFADEVKLLLAELTGGNLKTINENKKDPRLRKLMQYLGTEVGREEDKDIWVKKLSEKVEMLKKQPAGSKPVLIYITDVRFLNEAEYVRQQGGFILRVTRKGLEDNDTHSSETELDKIKPDYTINNDSGLGRLGWECRIVANFIKQRAGL